MLVVEGVIGIDLEKVGGGYLFFPLGRSTVGLLRHCASFDMRERWIVVSLTTRLLRDGGRSAEEGRKHPSSQPIESHHFFCISRTRFWLPVCLSTCTLRYRQDLVTAEIKPTRPSTSLSQVSAGV